MGPDSMNRPWEPLREVLARDDRERLTSLLDELGPAETARAISRLSTAEQNRLLTMLAPADAADLIEEIPDAQAIGLIEELPPQSAAAIVDEIQSDRQADLLAELDDADAEAIIWKMSPEEAADVRRLMAYDPDTAGGVMITEFVAFPVTGRVREVLHDLQANRKTYAGYHVQYMYVLEDAGKLVGVLRMHDLLFADEEARLASIMIRNPLKIRTDTNIHDLRQFFDEHRLLGVPVVDTEERLVGVVLPEDVREASRKEADHQFLGLSGIIGGEEFRSMPFRLRSGRRLSWLSINIVLNVAAASVIALYQDTLAAVIALAVFLPMISDMSGCSGNQAVAVSMRELTLGLLRPHEILRVVGKELCMGAFNGLLLGILLGGVALLWKGNPYLGLVVGVALMLNTIVAVSLGGALPLILKSVKLDPALVSSPVLTTVTDMCGFFLVLSFATILLPRLTGA